MQPNQFRRFKNAVEDIFTSNVKALQDKHSKITRICEIEKQMYDEVERQARKLAEEE